MRLCNAEKLVVFGAGYLGGVVAREGVARGMRVTGLTRNAEAARELEAAGVEAVVAELASEEWHERIGAADFVVNCVGAGGGGVKGYRKSYIEGMQSVVAWLRRNGGVAAGGGARGFIYTSSTSVYPQSGGVVVREGDEAGGVECDVRAQLLVEAEEIALRGGACVLRLAGIYGPGRHALLDQMRAGAAVLPGRADSRLNLIHRDDAAAAIWAVLERGGAGGSGSACESGGANGSGSAGGNGCGSAGEGLDGGIFRGEIFNVCDDEACLRGEVTEWLARRLGVRAPAFVEHGASLESGVAARGGAAARERAATRGRLDRVISNEKIKTRTGWRPRFASFREGYEALLRVYPEYRD